MAVWLWDLPVKDVVVEVSTGPVTTKLTESGYEKVYFAATGVSLTLSVPEDMADDPATEQNELADRMDSVRKAAAAISVGGSVSEKVKAIADRVYALEADWHAPLTETEDPAIASVKGGDLYEIRTAASRLSVRTDANWLAEGWGRTQKDSTGIEVLPLEPQEGVMPAVTGMSLKDALYLLESRGLRVQFSGRGKVVGQSIRAGSHITEGATVSLTLRP